ncbi:MAG: hypothetical protein U9R11_04130 [Chloroflexota bacterium]|nr:hypothetical protein [Chloroflexota bacterium]
MSIPEVRDVAIIVLAAESLLIGVFLGILLFKVQSLIKLLREEVKPILDSASQTTETVRSTTNFVSDTVVSPLIKIASYASAAKKAAEVWAKWHSKGKTNRGKEE